MDRPNPAFNRPVGSRYAASRPAQEPRAWKGVINAPVREAR